MATRRKNTRRRNPVRGVQTLVLNRRKPKTRKRRKASSKRTRVTRRRTNAISVRRRTNARRRKPATRRRRATTRRRRNAVSVRGRRINRRRTTKRRTATKRRSNTIKVRRNRYASTRRRNAIKVRRRRNAASGGSLTRMLNKIPLVGPIVAKAIGFISPMAIAAIGVEPTIALSKVAARYWPNFSAPLLTAVVGAVLAGFVAKTKFLGAAFHKKAALAIASGAAAVGWYQMRSGGLTQPVAEAMSGIPSYGAVARDLGFTGFPYRVAPAIGRR